MPAVLLGEAEPKLVEQHGKVHEQTSVSLLYSRIVDHAKPIVNTSIYYKKLRKIQ